MTLHLNQIQVKGHDMKVAATLPLAAADMSGQTSYTDTAETGDKPKQISVRMGITFKNAADLTALVKLAEAKNNHGSRVHYQVINETAQAMGIRLVKFEGDLSVNEDETTAGWRVAFKLTEVRSVPELKESRQQAKDVTEQAAEGDTVATNSASETAAPDQAQLSSFENVLKYIDTALAPDEGTTA